MSKLSEPKIKLRRALIAKRALMKRGIMMPPRPRKTKLTLPNQIDTLSTAQVTQHMNRWSQYLAYVKSELALADIRHRESEDAYDKRKAVRFIELRSNNPNSTITDLRAMIDGSKRFMQMHEEVEVLNAKLKLLTAIHEGADQNYKLLSRELTRRTHSIDRNLD